MTEQEKTNAIHALQNVLNPRMAGAEHVKILTDEQYGIVKNKLIEVIKSVGVED